MQADSAHVEETRLSRSFLFVPGDSERKLEKAVSAGADALILDLEDAVTPEARPAARELVAAYLPGKEDVWVRVNPVDGPDWEADLEAVMPAVPAGIVLPKPRHARDAVKLSEHMDVLENHNNVPRGSTKIIALCTEHPEALFTLNSYVDTVPRLAGLSWGAEDLSAAVGASNNRNTKGEWLPPYEMARSMCLFAAAAAEVAAIDTVFTDFRDGDGLLRYATNARRDGFSGMLAIHPAQVDVINAAFLPTDEEIERARRIVELFEQNPGTGAVALDGRMIDRPHLAQAQRILQQAKFSK
ncbi:MAG: CoA ester lyase [Gammaproteobacteria bacterium]|nr:CoA ester lyase [Gammaproteobacteria bacterium]